MEEIASTPHWLAVLTLRPDLRDLGVWGDAERAAVGEHFAGLQRLAAEGIVVLAGRTDEMDPPGRMAEDTVGLIVFQAPTREEAEALIARDAAVEAGIMRAKVHAFSLAALATANSPGT